MKTQAQVRDAFWQAHPQFARRMVPAARSRRTGRILYRVAAQNDYPCDVRVAFVDYVDMLSKDGTITSALAHCVTL